MSKINCYKIDNMDFMAKVSDKHYDLDIIEVDNDHYRDGVSRFNWHKRQQTINFPEL